jgi:ABC-type dipeptide/oligopeptide/nickel transport system permease subunit
MSIPAFGTADAAELLADEAAAAVSRSRVWQRLRSHPSALAGLGILALYIVGSIVGPLVIQGDAYHNDLGNAFLHSSPQHLLGTDDLGRDEFLRLLLGARFTLSIGFAAVAIGLIVGMPLGAISGFYGGWVDMVLQRLTDVLLAFPGILLALALVAGLGVGLQNVIISVGITSIPGFVRLMRASALSIRELPYVEAARALGVPSWQVLLHHVVPNSLAPIIVQATLQLGGAILVAAGLGFLGFGVQAPAAEWGTMLGFSRNYIFSDSNLVTYPGLAIFGAVLAFNLVGDGLRDALDPRLR